LWQSGWQQPIKLALFYFRLEAGMWTTNNIQDNIFSDKRNYTIKHTQYDSTNDNYYYEMEN